MIHLYITLIFSPHEVKSVGRVVVDTRSFRKMHPNRGSRKYSFDSSQKVEVYRRRGKWGREEGGCRGGILKSVVNSTGITFLEN